MHISHTYTHTDTVTHIQTDIRSYETAYHYIPTLPTDDGIIVKYNIISNFNRVSAGIQESD